MIEDQKTTFFTTAKKYIFQKSFQNLETIFSTQKTKISQNSINKLFLQTCQLIDQYGSFDEIYHYLLLKRPEINFKDNKGRTPLMFCTSKGRISLVKNLINQGALLNENDIFERNCLFYVLKSEESYQIKLLEFFLQKGMDIDKIDCEGDSVVLKGLKRKCDSAVGFLIQKNGDLKKRNRKNFNALDMIFVKNNKDLIKRVQRKMNKQKFEELVVFYDEEKILKIKEDLIKNEIFLFKEESNFCNLKIFGLNDNQKTEDSYCAQKKNSFFYKDRNFINFNDSSFSKEIIKKNGSFESTKKKTNNNNIVKEKKSILNLEIKLKHKIKENNQIKKKIKDLKQKNQICFFKKKKNNKEQHYDYVQNLYKKISEDIILNQKLIENYQKKTKKTFLKTFEKIKKIMKNYFEDKIILNLSGSLQTDLFMPWSDLNIITIFKEKKYFNYEKITNFVHFLKKKKYIQKINYEERTRLVIIKIELANDLNKKKKVEIIFKHNNLNYPNNEDIIKNYLISFPILKPLYLIFRKMLKFQNLDCPITGLKSLVIILLLVGFLQKMEFLNKMSLKEVEDFDKEKRGLIFSKMEIGEIFSNFLFYFSYTFDYKNELIFTALTNDEIRDPIERKDLRKINDNFVVANPYNKDIILTKSFKKIKELRQFFKLSYISLFNTCICANDRICKIFFKIHKNKKGFKKNNEILIEYKIVKKNRESKKSYVIQREDILRRNSEFISLSKKENNISNTIFPEKENKNVVEVENSNFSKENYEIPTFIMTKILNFNSA